MRSLLDRLKIRRDSGEYWVAVGSSGSLASSLDGINWTLRTSSVANTLQRVAYGNGTWVAVGDNGIVISSTDGINWASRVSNAGGNALYDVAYGNGLWVATGFNATLVTSPDGITWTSRVTPFVPTGGGIRDTIRSVCYWNLLWMIGGNRYTTTILCTSADGIIWTQKNTALYPNIGKSIRGIAYGNNRWVIGSTDNSDQSLLLTETLDTNTYVTSTFHYGFLSAPEFRFVRFVNGNFNVSGTITSPTLYSIYGQGATSNPMTPYVNTSLNIGSDIAYLGGTYIMVGSSGKITSSVNGTTWGPEVSPFGANNPLGVAVRV